MARKNDERKELQLAAEREAKHLETVEVVAQIDTQEHYVEAGELRKDIRRGQKAIEEAKRRIVEPLNEALRNVRSLFKPWEQMASLKLRAIDRAMDDYERREEQKRRDEERRLRELQRSRTARGSRSPPQPRRRRRALSSRGDAERSRAS